LSRFTAAATSGKRLVTPAMLIPTLLLGLHAPAHGLPTSPRDTQLAIEALDRNRGVLSSPKAASFLAASEETELRQQLG
jgi:hypothetical protein